MSIDYITQHADQSTDNGRKFVFELIFLLIIIVHNAWGEPCLHACGPFLTVYRKLLMNNIITANE